jgi:hypothetical protein
VIAVAALLALPRRFPQLSVLAERPFLALALAGLLAITGAAFQYGRAGAPGKRAAPPPLSPPPVDDTRRTV